MMVFLLSGEAQVGKTTLAKIIAKKAYDKGLTPVMLSFASPLKDELALQGIAKDTHDPAVFRKAAQELGAKRRAENPDYWVNKLRDRIAFEYDKENEYQDTVSKEHERVIIIDDMRFPNETKLVGLLDAMWIHVSPGRRKLSDHKAEWRNDKSEAMAKELNGAGEIGGRSPHFTLLNDATLKIYERSIDIYWKAFLNLTEYAVLNSLCSCPDCLNVRIGNYSCLEQLERSLETLEEHTDAKSEEEADSAADAEDGNS